VFNSIPHNAFEEYQGDVNKGDIIELKPGMMLIEPGGPVIVLESDNDKGIYEIMYLRNNYVVGVGRMDIKKVIDEID
tara:strand:- start:4992 stop:5222 length:231 start_codon:yes stop_codon:yes gene_type:complete